LPHTLPSGSDAKQGIEPCFFCWAGEIAGQDQNRPFGGVENPPNGAVHLGRVLVYWISRFTGTDCVDRQGSLRANHIGFPKPPQFGVKRKESGAGQTNALPLHQI